MGVALEGLQCWLRVPARTWVVGCFGGAPVQVQSGYHIWWGGSGNCYSALDGEPVGPGLRVPRASLELWCGGTRSWQGPQELWHCLSQKGGALSHQVARKRRGRGVDREGR